MGYHNTMHLIVPQKKQALVMLYKLWSGFTKSLRYILLSRVDSNVKLARIGTFTRNKDNETGLICFGFQPSTELLTAVNNSGGQANCEGDSTTAKAVQLDWNRIADGARLQNGDIAKSLVQALFAAAVGMQLEGLAVALNMRVGRLMIQGGDIKFTSQTFGSR